MFYSPGIGIILSDSQGWLLGTGFYNPITSRVTVTIQLEQPLAFKIV